MSGRAIGVVLVAAAVLLDGLLAACTPLPDSFSLANHTSHPLTVWWGPVELGSADAGATEKIELPNHSCVTEPLRAVTTGGELATLLDGPTCDKQRIEVTSDDLSPATARATVVNDTASDVDLSFITGEDLVAAPGEQVEVALQVPAGACLSLLNKQYEYWRADEVPVFWGEDLCDGEVKPLSPPASPAVDVDNRTNRELTVLNGTTVLGVVGPRSRAPVPLPSVECVVDAVRVLDPGRARTARLPDEVCPFDVLVVESLVSTAQATITNATDREVDITLSGPALSTTDVILRPHRSQTISLESMAGTCVLVDGVQGKDSESIPSWSGYLCDGATLTASPSHPEGVGEIQEWVATW